MRGCVAAWLRGCGSASERAGERRAGARGRAGGGACMHPACLSASPALPARLLACRRAIGQAGKRAGHARRQLRRQRFACLEHGQQLCLNARRECLGERRDETVLERRQEVGLPFPRESLQSHITWMRACAYARPISRHLHERTRSGHGVELGAQVLDICAVPVISIDIHQRRGRPAAGPPLPLRVSGRSAAVARADQGAQFLRSCLGQRLTSSVRLVSSLPGNCLPGSDVVGHTKAVGYVVAW